MLRSALAAALLALNAPPPVPVDYQVCVPIHNGPIHPQHRENGVAPLADIAVLLLCATDALLLECWFRADLLKRMGR